MEGVEEEGGQLETVQFEAVVVDLVHPGGGTDDLEEGEEGTAEGVEGDDLVVEGTVRVAVVSGAVEYRDA